MEFSSRTLDTFRKSQGSRMIETQTKEVYCNSTSLSPLLDRIYETITMTISFGVVHHGDESNLFAE